MRQAHAVSRDGRDPKTFMPWQRDQPTRSFSQFKKDFPFMFPKRPVKKT